MRCLPWISLAACYAPTPQAGAPCSERDECPAPLRCELATRTCERGPGGAVDAAVEDGEVPPPPDGAPDGCWAAWLAGPPMFSAPRQLAALATPANEANAALSADNLALYFVRSGDLFRATRGDLDGAFDTPQRIIELSFFGVSRLAPSSDELEAIFVRRGAGEGGRDLWRTTRAAIDKPFEPPVQAGLALLNDAEDQFDPELTPDDLRIYFAPTTPTGQILVTATRPSREAAFSPPVPVEIQGIDGVLADPSISPDGRVLAFSREPPGDPSTLDLYVATRTAPVGAFTAVKLEALDVAEAQGDPELTADGCQLYFSSGRPGGDGGRDLWVADVVVP